MPGFATSEHTRGNAWRLMEALGITAEEIDIRPSANADARGISAIPRPGGEPVYDITFENVQAGERTSHLFRLANHHNGLVIGTGDLSELALGWSTYGVGDQMSHYNVNASVPKTLIQFLMRWVIDTGQFGADERGPAVGPRHRDLARARSRRDADKPAQDSESTSARTSCRTSSSTTSCASATGPARSPSWPTTPGATASRAWPDLIPPAARNEYELGEIKHWLEVFLDRFFRTSQFKRSALPNGPKVGSGGSLSPRGDWRAPSDSAAAAWLEELRANVPD